MRVDVKFEGKSEKKEIEFSDGDTVSSAKTKIQKATGVALAAQIIVHEEIPLLNGLSKLANYGIKSGIVHNKRLSFLVTNSSVLASCAFVVF